MDEQEHPASPEAPESGDTAAVTGPTAGPGAAVPGRERRGDGVRDVITSRAAGWAVAAAMTGAVVGLSVAMATSSSPTVVVRPDRAAGLRETPAGTASAAIPGALRAVASGGLVQAQAPTRLRIQIPAAGPLQTPARLRIQVPAGGPRQAPVRLRIRIPGAGPRQALAQVRLPALMPGPAGMWIPLPGVAQALPGKQVIAAPRAVRVRVRPGQVRVRLRVSANRRLQVLPGGAVPGPLRVVGAGPAALVPAAPARLRIAFRHGMPVTARLVAPASVPGQARLRIQLPARARIRVPAQARTTRALPAPPSW